MSNRILILHFLAILALAACSSPPQSTATPTLPPSDTPSAVSATPTPPETPTTVPTTAPEPAPTATPEPTPSPTAVPLRFGFEPGMTVDDCNPLTLTADNKIPDDYLAAERTWIAQNRPPFSQIGPFGYATEIRYLTDYHFPLPVYPIFAPGQGYGQPGPEQWMTSCAALPDGTIVFSAIVRPSYMPDMLNVRPDNIPVLHFAYPQASHDWVMEHTDLFYQLEGARGPVASPSEVLEMINSPYQMAALKNMSFWVVAPASNLFDLTVLPPALEPLSRFIALNSAYDSEIITRQWPGFVDITGDLVMFMSYGNVDGLPLSGQLSNIVLPVLGISFAY